LQRFPAHRGFDGLEVATGDGPRSYELLDFREDFGFKRRFEAPFFTVSAEAASKVSNSASAQRSQASQYASMFFRNACPCSSCRRTTSASFAFNQRDWVFPFTTRETL